MQVNFDLENHIYRNSEGLQVPGVSSILVEFGIIPEGVIKFANPSLGKAVHVACELDDNGTLDEDSLDPRVRSRLEQWRKFKNDMKCEIIINEEPMISRMGYAGCPDNVIRIDGFNILIDKKSSKVRSKSTKIQLVAYKNMIKDAKNMIISECWEVYLGDTEYKVIKHEDNLGEHWNAFKAMVQIHYYKLR